MHKGRNNSAEGAVTLLPTSTPPDTLLLLISPFLAYGDPSVASAETLSAALLLETLLRRLLSINLSWQHCTTHAPRQEPFIWGSLHVTHRTLHLYVSVSPSGL